MELNEIETKLHAAISVDEEAWINIDAALNKAWNAGYDATHARIDSPEVKIEELEKEVEELKSRNKCLEASVKDWEEASIDKYTAAELAKELTKHGYFGTLTRCETLNVGE